MFCLNFQCLFEIMTLIKLLNHFILMVYDTPLSLLKINGVMETQESLIKGRRRYKIKVREIDTTPRMQSKSMRDDKTTLTFRSYKPVQVQSCRTS
jgi:hypothetical protein